MRARLLLPLIALALAGVLSACGTEEGSNLAKSNPLNEGEQIFNRRCAGCHSLSTANAEGSASTPMDMERKDGPNFNQRKEQYEDVLYAIQNGGFSSGPMPQNIVVGNQAKVVACFVATYSGRDAAQDPSPGESTETSTETRDCKSELPAR